MLYRLVLYRFKADASPDRIEELDRLRDELSDALFNDDKGAHLLGSPTLSAPQGPTGSARSGEGPRRFTRAWIVQAEDAVALQHYIDHSIHLEMIAKMDCLEDVVVEDIAIP